jgi:DNA invertase Pin-like site-specific DNA recombinase
METTPKSTKKAFGYLRVSGKSQVEGDGFPRQKAAIQKWAKANGYRIAEWFTEEGVSGTLESREALDAMLVALMSNGVDTVIVEALHRFSRDLRVQENLIHQYFTNRFTLISATEPELGNDDPNRVFMRQIFGAVHQLDKSNLVLKLRAARQRKKATTGHCEGRKPYGSRPGEVEVLARIQAMSASGVNNEKIAQTLNTEGIKTRSGGKWYSSTLYNIFKKIRNAEFDKAYGFTQ